MDWISALLVAGPGGRHAWNGGAVIIAVLLLGLLLGDWQ